MYYINHEVSNDVVQRRGVDPGHIWDDTDEAVSIICLQLTLL